MGLAGHVSGVAEFTAHQGVSDVGSFIEKLRIAAIIPGLEVEIPVGSRTLLRPFGEVGFGRSGDSSEVFYGVGVRAQNVADLKRLHLTYGGIDCRTEGAGTRRFGQSIRQF